MYCEKDHISRLLAGEETAYIELLNIYQCNVINLCYRFLLNRELAEDTAQEVFIEVFLSLKNFRSNARLSTWLYRIAVTKSLDEIRKQKRKKRISSFGSLLTLDHISEWFTCNESPDTILEEKESLDLLLNILNQLPDNQRIALTLSKVEGFSNPEIAELMNTSVYAVEALIYRGRQKLNREKSHSNVRNFSDSRLKNSVSVLE